MNNNGEKYFYSPPQKYDDALNVWFCFPAEYSIGMSSLGYLNLFKILDEKQNVSPVRVFTNTQNTLFSSKNVDLISFSYSFEFDFINILKFFKKNNIDCYSINRGENTPLIMGGGVVLTANPEPFYELFDFILVGDGEELISEVTDILYEFKHLSKKEKLEKLSQIDGCYVPSVSSFENIKRRTYKFQDCIYSPITTVDTAFSDTFLIEVTRGCPHKCNFCLTSHVNTPVHYAHFDAIKNAVNIGIKNSSNIGLLGALVPSNPCFEDLCEYLMQRHKENNFKVSIGSLRADFVTPMNVKMLTTCGQKSATIAIEAGSQRLRDFINKKLSEDEILNAVNTCYENGLDALKLYGIIGLPSETDEDIAALSDLVKKIKLQYKKKLTLSINSFVPKKFTPFKNESMESIKSLEKKLTYLKKECHKSGISLKSSSLAWNEIQGIISLGDRKLFEKLLLAYNSGSTIGAFRKAFRTK